MIIMYLMFQDRIGASPASSSIFQTPSRSAGSSSDFQPPYFPPPLSQEQQQLFSSLPVSLASLQPSLAPVSSEPGYPVTSLSAFPSGHTRRLTEESSSPNSLVSSQAWPGQQISRISQSAANISGSLQLPELLSL